MAGEYLINWSDDQNGSNALKPRFTINPNTVDGPGNTSANTPLQLPGRFTVNYGERIAESFCHLMEHFASPTEPSIVTSGLIWFDTTDGVDGVLRVRNVLNTEWIVVGTGASGGANGGAGGKPELSPSSGTANFTAVAGGNYFVNTTGGSVTATLPDAPEVGDNVGFIDMAGTFDVNSLFINGDGNLVMGDAGLMENDVKYSCFRLAYSGATYGWRISG